MHVFKPVKGCVEIYVGYVHANTFCFRSGEHTVEVDFDGFKADGASACFTRVFSDEISSGRDLSLIGILFLGKKVRQCVHR